MKILDALSATGLRSVRYAKEVNFNDLDFKIVANDILPKASETIKMNIASNEIEEKVEVTIGDAS